MSRTFLNTAVAAACVCHSLGRKVCFARLPSPASTHIRHLGPYRPFTINIDSCLPHLGMPGRTALLMSQVFSAHSRRSTTMHTQL